MVVEVVVVAAAAAVAAEAAAGAAITTTTAAPSAVPGWLASWLSRPGSCRIYNTRREGGRPIRETASTDCRASEGGNGSLLLAAAAATARGLNVRGQ